jgi:hypothetical protein
MVSIHSTQGRLGDRRAGIWVFTQKVKSDQKTQKSGRFKAIQQVEVFVWHFRVSADNSLHDDNPSLYNSHNINGVVSDRSSKWETPISDMDAVRAAERCAFIDNSDDRGGSGTS